MLETAIKATHAQRAAHERTAINTISCRFNLFGNGRSVSNWHLRLSVFSNISHMTHGSTSRLFGGHTCPTLVGGRARGSRAVVTELAQCDVRAGHSHLKHAFAVCGSKRGRVSITLWIETPPPTSCNRPTSSRSSTTRRLTRTPPSMG